MGDARGTNRMKLLNFPENVYSSYESFMRAMDAVKEICGDFLKIDGKILRKNFEKPERKNESWIGDDLI
jgi:hypothetical protein